MSLAAFYLQTQEAHVSKKKSGNGKNSRPGGGFQNSGKQSVQRGAPMSRRPPRQPGR
jgi:hypothetical protein